MRARISILMVIGMLALILASPISAKRVTPHLYIPALKVWVQIGACAKACTFNASQQILDREVMWWPGTKTRPGSGGVYAIAGHDVTPVPGFRSHGPFHYLYRMHRRQVIFIFWHGLIYKYRVYRVTAKPVGANALGSAPGERLVLSTCWPPYSAAKRMLVYAKRV